MSSKSKSKMSASVSQSTQRGSLFILHYKSRRVLVGSPTDYDQLQLAIRRHFPEIPANHRVSYHTDELAISKGALVEVSEDIWETAIPLLNTLTVQSSPKTTAGLAGAGKRATKREHSECDSSCDESPPQKPLTKKSRPEFVPLAQIPISSDTSMQVNNMITLTIHKGDGEQFQVRCKLSTSLRALLETIRKRLGDVNHDWIGLWEENRIDEFSSGTVHSLGLWDGDNITLRKLQKGGKPIIYLFPPSRTEIDASIKLSLVPEWSFSCIYPVVSVDSSGSDGQMLQWDVKVSSDGTLLEKNTGLEVAYLFWEAEAPALSKQIPLSNDRPPLGHLSTDETFIPTHAHLEPSNSVVLEAAKITPYLDSALKALGLHTEARTSFITYWLPSILKHTYVALRFLPQQAYERAAPLEVSPTPDVVVRVFMLFKGLKPDEVLTGSTGGWNMPTGDVDVNRWRKIVGIDDNSSLADETLFRVLEWGGMEVLA